MSTTVLEKRAIDEGGSPKSEAFKIYVSQWRIDYLAMMVMVIIVIPGKMMTVYVPV